jgi:subfamily B ATP-binding cassette protein MsbA
VIFGYEDGTPVLNNISFDIHPGKTVALIGPSGAGKSTTVQLLLRFFDPQSGKIQLDGHDLKSLDLESYLSQVALVPQETLLFGGTIRENILYGKLDATDTEIIEASKSANAHDFIVEFSNGYDTLVGEKGTKLSGGERQRIAIARALLKNPKVLVLDEATSALDNQSEMLIQDALAKLMVGRTTFIIAHRLSTVHNADKIIVLDKGKIVESGTHKELMANESLYHHLYTLRLIEAESPFEAPV